MGFDRNSVVADPLFVDPKNDDYRLDANSPAWKLGFKAIPVDKIGPYESADRASWPIVEAAGAAKPAMSGRYRTCARRRPESERGCCSFCIDTAHAWNRGN